jgi:hypothetical protein
MVGWIIVGINTILSKSSGVFNNDNDDKEDGRMMQ